MVVCDIDAYNGSGSVPGPLSFPMRFLFLSVVSVVVSVVECSSCNGFGRGLLLLLRRLQPADGH